MNELALICVISARDSVILKKSLKKWDNGDKIDGLVRDNLLTIISGYYEKSYGSALRVV